MIIDGYLLFTGTSNGQTGGITASANTDLPTTGTQAASNIIDLGNKGGLPATAVNGGGARDIGIGDDPSLKLLAVVTTAITGGTSLGLQLQGAPDAGSDTAGSYTTMWTGPVIAEAGLVAGAQLANIDVPRAIWEQVLPRYNLKLNFISVGTHSAGAIEKPASSSTGWTRSSASPATCPAIPPASPSPTEENPIMKHRILLGLLLLLGIVSPAFAQVNYVPQVGTLSAILKNPTYSAVSVGLVPASAATDIFCISAGSSRNISLKHITVGGRAGTAITTPISNLRTLSPRHIRHGGHRYRPPSRVEGPTQPIRPSLQRRPHRLHRQPDRGGDPAINGRNPRRSPSHHSWRRRHQLRTQRYGTTYDVFDKSIDSFKGTTVQVCVNLNGVTVSSGVLVISMRFGRRQTNMARWKLINSHYLNVPGEKWEYKELDRNTGRERRIQIDVPRLLDPNDPGCWTNRWGNKDNADGEIVVCHAGKGDSHDIIFIGDPTPDMIPVDDEAKEISNSFAEHWRYKPDNADISFSQSLVDKFQIEMEAVAAKPVEIPGMADLGFRHRPAGHYQPGDDEIGLGPTPEVSLMAKGMGFKAAQAGIARKEGVGKKAAGAILASASRRASPSAKAANPNLKKVK